MRVLIDANILISLLVPQSGSKPSPVRELLPLILSAGHVVLVAEETLIEVRSTVETKPWFRGRVSIATAERLFAAVGSRAEVLPSLAYTAPHRCRDRQDDYLLEQAIRFGADVLVTGDGDLLALDGTISGLHIVSTRALLDQLSG